MLEFQYYWGGEEKPGGLFALVRGALVIQLVVFTSFSSTF